MNLQKEEAGVFVLATEMEVVVIRKKILLIFYMNGRALKASNFSFPF